MSVRLSTCFLLAVCLADAQAPSPTLSAPTTEYLRGLLAEPAMIGTGFAEKALSRWGDATAVALCKTMSTKELSDPKIEGQILQLMMMSFVTPEFVRREDRYPKVTLVVLTAIKHLTMDRTTLVKAEKLYSDLATLDASLSRMEAGS